MTTANQAHEAASSIATSERAAEKKWWEKKTFINITVTIVAIIVAVIVHREFPMNFYWKMIVGIGLIFAGGSAAKVQFTVVAFWGKMGRGIGWGIILMALITSGIGRFTQGVVIWVDQSLMNTEISQKYGGATPTKTYPSIPGIETTTSTPQHKVSLAFKQAIAGEKTEVKTVALDGIIELFLPPIKLRNPEVRPCMKLIDPLRPSVPIVLWVVSGWGTSFPQYILSMETQNGLRESGVKTLTFQFEYVNVPGECAVMALKK